MIEELTHNRSNEVTAGIWRVADGDGTAVLKVLAPPRGPAGSPWAASDEPAHWNYWRREALFYESELPARFEEGGIGPPRLLDVTPRADGTIALRLEDVRGGTGPDSARTARALGRVQARGPAAHPWLSRGFLRDYTASKRAPWELLDDDEAWAQPLVRDCFPAGLRAPMTDLHRGRELYLGLLERLPRTLCHLDVWPANLLAREDGTPVLVDWAFLGDGALGEDAGNLVPDSVFDLFVPASQLPELDRLVYAAYVEGLREGGWRGDERLVRLAMCASAVKYDWLVPVMLGQAAEPVQLDYGRERSVPAELRFRERGATFAFLAGWAEEAQRLAGELEEAGLL